MPDKDLITEPKEKKPYITRIPAKDLEKKIKFFLKHGIPFRKESTKGRSIVHAKNGWGSWMNEESTFRAGELSFIKNVKAHVKKYETWRGVRNNFKKEGSTNKIKYFYYNKKLNPGTEFNNIIEIDLKNAYWTTAFKLGLFDEHIYQKGLTVSKKSRLAAVGSFAKVIKVFEFDGKDEENLDPIHEKDVEFLWHTISYRVGKIMAKASKAAGKDFCFFWVDAVFVLPNAQKAVIKVFKDAGFQFTTSKCEWLKVSDKKIEVKSTAKAKFVDKKIEEEIVVGNKKFIKRYTKKVYKDTRFFHFENSMSETDIMNLSL